MVIFVHRETRGCDSNSYFFFLDDNENLIYSMNDDEVDTNNKLSYLILNDIHNGLF